MKHKLWFTALLIMSILAISMPTVAVEPVPPSSEEALPLTRPLGDQRPRLPGNRIALEFAHQDAPGSSTTAPVQIQADINLILDDGSAENSIGLTPPTQFIFLNRFTPDPCDFAFDLDQMRVYFESGEVQVGDNIILVAYENTSGSFDPAVGSNWLASFPTTVQAVDAWNVYNLNPPVRYDGPGDVLLGVIALEAPDPYHPAAIDTTASQKRSWVGWWTTTPPDPPTLPPPSWLLIDNAGYAGNWMIRGYGSRGTQTARVVLEPQAQIGRGEPTNVLQYNVTLFNCTGQAGSFDITYSGHSWGVTGPPTIGPLANGNSTIFQVAVTVPGAATCPECDTVEVAAQAQTNPALTDAATIETCVGEDWQNESNTGTQGAHWLAYTCTEDVGTQGTCFYFGGLGPGNTVTGYAQKYDIASGIWTRITDLPAPVFGAVAGYIDGKIYVAGGFTATTDPWPPTGALQIYDIAGNSWSSGANLPYPRGGVSGGVVNGRLYVAGGLDETSEYSAVHEYNPGTNQWTLKASLPDYIWFGAGTGSANHLYVGGDYRGKNGFYEYDPVANAWEAQASLPGSAGKKSPVMAVAPDCGGVFLYGGDWGDWGGIQDTTWYWHPVGNLWVNYGVTLNERTTDAGGGYADGRLWSFAGSQGSGPIIPPPHESLNYCCPPHPPTGNIEGHVTDANSGLPLENANVFFSDPTDPLFEESTWTDASGYYFFGPLLVGDYEVRAAAYGYHNGNALVSVTEDVTVTVDFVLDAAIPDLTPLAVNVEIQANSADTFTLTLANDGTGDLHFHVSELPSGTTFPIPKYASAPANVDSQVYDDLAASPDGTTTFFVFLEEQADLSRAFTIEDRSARGHYVLNALQATAERAQSGLKAELAHAGVAYESRYIVNALLVKGNLNTVTNLATRPEVAYVGANHAIPAPEPVKLEPATQEPQTLEWNIEKVRADDVWSTFGVRGNGIVVANIDTGVQWDHPALVNQYRGGPGGNHNHNWWDPYGYGPTAPYDFHNHGSHTMGTMVGDDGLGNQIGMAPGATWFACQGFDKNTGSGYEAELLECAEFILAPWDLNGANPDPDLRADVVNNSWGGDQAQWWYNQVIYAWRAAGIFPSFSAGNNGPNCKTMGDPGDMANIMAVGATDNTDSNAPGSTASFSSRGPAKFTDLLKPNVSAPGVNIRSAYRNGDYGWMGGTSMASPHVAGEAALIWSARPELRGDVQLTYWVIEHSADPLVVDQGYYCGKDTGTSVPNNQYGWGRINAYAAVNMALGGNWDIPWLTVEPEGGVLSPAASADIVLTFDTIGLTPGDCYNGTLKVEFNEPYTAEVFVPVELCVKPVYVYKEVEPFGLDPGEPLTYTIVFGNNGVPVSGAVLSDTLPAEVEFASAHPPAAYDPEAHELVWTGLDLATDSRMTATVTVAMGLSVGPCTRLHNDVYLFYGGLEPSRDTAWHTTLCRYHLPVIYKNH